MVCVQLNQWAMKRHRAGTQPEIFQGKLVFMKLGHFDKHFVKKSRKKTRQRKILVFFLVDTLKTTFWTENLSQKWTQPGPFFIDSGHFSDFQKK